MFIDWHLEKVNHGKNKTCLYMCVRMKKKLALTSLTFVRTSQFKQYCVWE